METMPRSYLSDKFLCGGSEFVTQSQYLLQYGGVAQVYSVKKSA